MRDFKRLQNDPPQGVQAAPLDNNVMVWHAVIFGPDDTPWEVPTQHYFIHSRGYSLTNLLACLLT